jgi:hypothetical protein
VITNEEIKQRFPFASTIDIDGILDAVRTAGRDAERARCASIVLAECKRWYRCDNDDGEMDQFAMGAIGASSNILARVYDLPEHVNQTKEG